MKNFTILLLALFIKSATFACANISAPTSLNIAIDPNAKEHYFYNETRMLWDKPDFSMSNCLKTASSDKYVMVAVALENFILSDEFLTYSINDSISGSGEECKIKNQKFTSVQNSSERRQRLLEKRKFVNHCLQLEITDFSQSGITAKESQPGCRVTKLSNHTIRVEGPFCYVKPSVDSSYSFNLYVKEECKNIDYYQDQELLLQDVLGVISLYTSGDDSGFSTDLTSLKQVNLRVSTNPDSKLVKNNSDLGEQRPTWPTEWHSTEVYIAQPKANFSGSVSEKLNFPLLVNNRCERKCIGSVCSSACDYSQSVVGEFALYGIKKNGKKEFLSSWFDGGVAPAQWQGILSGVGVSLPKDFLEFNKKYILEVDLSDQELNYLSFKGRIEKQIRMNNNIGAMNHGGTGIREIPFINNIEELNNLPTIKDITGIYFTGNGFNGVQEALRSVQLTFKNSFWPPYFEEYCFEAKCLKQGAVKNKLILEFTLEGDAKKPLFSNVKFSRQSNLVGMKALSDYSFPALDCGNNDIPDIDMGDFDF